MGNCLFCPDEIQDVAIKFRSCGEFLGNVRKSTAIRYFGRHIVVIA